MSLKALANIGRMSKNFESTLIAMIEDVNLEVETRVAAIQTFRRLPCERSRPYFESLFRNKKMEVEVRIASYLQMFRCPNYMVIRTVRYCLQIEEVNQGTTDL